MAIGWKPIPRRVITHYSLFTTHYSTSFAMTQVENLCYKKKATPPIISTGGAMGR